MNRNNIKYFLIGIVCIQISCKGFLQVDPPKNSLVEITVFQNNDQATSALLGIYATIGADSYGSGNAGSISALAGLSSDELIGHNAFNIPFYQNQLIPSNYYVTSVYTGLYKTIYTSNAILEGIELGSGMTPPVKIQIQGEALFIRSFAYFYLLNLYGNVPLNLTTDYRITNTSTRTPVVKIYDQIVKDLKVAEQSLVDTYASSGRVRPNKSTVQALLARVYLYMEDWGNAEKYASLLIEKSNTYSLIDVDEIFKANSQETIWQIFPRPNTNAGDGNLYIPFNSSAAPTNVTLSSFFALSAFEPNDKRQRDWVKSYTNNFGTFYYPFKYKVQSATVPTEYSVIFRLAEQYLIRAEARIEQGKISLGIVDINKIRTRARTAPNVNNPNPLPDLSISLSKADALIAVEKERRIELFSEWGHRWFDLKRKNRAEQVLNTVKSDWNNNDLLYPIPQVEINVNPNITQNPGY